MTNKKNFFSYLVLLIILVVGFYFFVKLSYNQGAQELVVGLTALGYLLWGTLYHVFKKDLSLPILLEYLFLSVLFTLSALVVLSQK